MRNPEEFRAWKLGRLRLILERPSTFGRGAIGADTLMWNLLDDRAYIDDKEDASHQARKAVLVRYDSLGVAGLGRWFEGGAHIGSSEVVSVYVELAHQLGWIDVDRVLDDDEFVRLGFADSSGYRDCDRFMSELAKELGPPSVVVGKSTRCFLVQGDERRWVYLDFDRWPPPSPDPLRNIRLPAGKALDALVFSPTGRTKYHPAGP